MTYKVFISSTFLDNAERRKTFIEVIERAGMQPVGMERFTAYTAKVAEKCKELAAEADLPVETERKAESTAVNLRLHTDVHRHLRRGDLLEQGRSLSTYLKAVLIERKDGRHVNPVLQVHIGSLFLQFGEVEDFIAEFINDFFDHLYRTGRLSWAMELEKGREELGLKSDNKDRIQRSYGNQALILQAWGRLNEAMALHKKEEALCDKLGNKNSLQICHGKPLFSASRTGKRRRMPLSKNRG